MAAFEGLPTPAQNETLTTSLPSEYDMSTPESHIWQCGHTTHLYLPENWCGSCFRAKLHPATVVIPRDDVSSHMHHIDPNHPYLFQTKEVYS